jgi:hypothetical protein
MVRMPGCPSALHSHVDIVVVRVRRLVRPASGFRAIGHGPPEPQHPLLSEQCKPSPALFEPIASAWLTGETIPPIPFGPHRLPGTSSSPHLQGAFSPLDSVSMLILSGRVAS